MEDIVMVPVPRKYLEVVYRAMGEAGVQQDQPETAKNTPAASENSGDSDWSPEELIRAYRESPPPMRTVLNRLAENAGEAVTGSELVEEVYGDEDSRGYRKLPGALGAFGRRVKNRYGKSSWPFTSRWDYGEKEMHYEMDKWSAEHIKKAISES